MTYFKTYLFLLTTFAFQTVHATVDKDALLLAIQENNRFSIMVILGNESHQPTFDDAYEDETNKDLDTFGRNCLAVSRYLFHKLAVHDKRCKMIPEILRKLSSEISAKHWYVGVHCILSRDEDGKTPLVHAIINNNALAVKALITNLFPAYRKSYLREQDKDGKSALDHLAQSPLHESITFESLLSLPYEPETPEDDLVKSALLMPGTTRNMPGTTKQPNSVSPPPGSPLFGSPQKPIILALPLERRRKNTSAAAAPPEPAA